ncbi:MAG: Transposase, partial [uncultured Pseudonocardia sp.]
WIWVRGRRGWRSCSGGSQAGSSGPSRGAERGRMCRGCSPRWRARTGGRWP